jgi:micrococcal nuclease
MRAWLLIASALVCAACPLGPGSVDDDDDSVAFDPALLPQGDPPVRAAIEAWIDSVYDGDTADVTTAESVAETVRLLSVDTPEMSSDGGGPECYAVAARDHTRQRLPQGQHVWLTWDGEERDMYGRLLCYVFVGAEPDAASYDDWVNYDLVRNGYAREYVWDNNDSFRDLFEGAEADAIAEGLGRWSECD